MALARSSDSARSAPIVEPIRKRGTGNTVILGRWVGLKCLIKVFNRLAKGRHGAAPVAEATM